jgi:hypothetical protein
MTVLACVLCLSCIVSTTYTSVVSRISSACGREERMAEAVHNTGPQSTVVRTEE